MKNSDLRVTADLLFVLHTDTWYWNDARLVGGLPIGITFHVVCGPWRYRSCSGWR